MILKVYRKYTKYLMFITPRFLNQNEVRMLDFDKISIASLEPPVAFLGFTPCVATLMKRLILNWCM